MTSLARHRTMLRELAAHHGVARGYRDTTGRWKTASDLALSGVLFALGVPADTDEEVASGLARAEAATRPLLDEVLVVPFGGRQTARLGPLSPRGRRAAIVDVRTEDGGIERRRLSSLLAGSPSPEEEGSLDLAPLGLPVGEHRLRLEVGEEGAEATVFVRPLRAGRPRRGFGVFAPLYGLRSESDWGIGSTAELAHLACWAADQRAAFVGTLPLYATHYDAPIEVSPYLPVSRVAWNEIYLDVPGQPELAVAPEARAHLANRAFRHEQALLQRAAAVDYPQVYAKKRKVLELLAASVEHGPRAEAFARFIASSPLVVAYARYRAEREPGDQTRRLAARRYHEYGQFAMSEALAELGRAGAARLYLDLPIGVHPEGFDPHHFAAAFLTGASVGAPPDRFFAEGQNWGIPPLRPDQAAFDYWRAVLRHVLPTAGVLRLDHVMWLERCFLVPHGLTPADGAYVRYPSAALRALLAIEAARHRVALVGEDLGTVPPETRRAMRRDGMLRSFVFQFAATAADPEPAAPQDALASFGSHDLPRFASYARGADLAERAAAGALDASSVRADRRERDAVIAALARRGDGERGTAKALRGLCAWLAETPAELAVVDLGDLVLDPEQENRPGPESGRTSWRHRLPLRVEDLDGASLVRRRLAPLSGRAVEDSQ